MTPIRTQPERTGPQPVVLILVLRETDAGTEVLLGRKLTGFGAGNIVAPGGKIEPGELPGQAAIRELQEETSLRVEPAHARHRASILFRFPARPRSDMDCHVYTTTQFAGRPARSRELNTCWYPVSALPVEHMWQDAEHWLPRIVAGERFTATVVMKDDNLGVERVSFRPW